MTPHTHKIFVVGVTAQMLSFAAFPLFLTTTCTGVVVRTQCSDLLLFGLGRLGAPAPVGLPRCLVVDMVKRGVDCSTLSQSFLHSLRCLRHHLVLVTDGLPASVGVYPVQRGLCLAFPVQELHEAVLDLVIRIGPPVVLPAPLSIPEFEFY